MRKIKAPKKVDEAFRKLQSIYKLQTPEQIKMNILWYHLKAIVKDTYPNQRELLEQYDQHWKLCEEIEKFQNRT